MKKQLFRLALSTALSGALGAHAAVITFDGLEDSPLAPFMSMGLLGHNEEFYQAGMWIDPWSTKSLRQDHDLVGALVNGSDLTNTCSGVICPSNNATTFYAALNDSQLYLGNVDGSTFGMSSFDASFVAASGDVVPLTALILRVDGFTDGVLTVSQDFSLPGPNAGAYSFSTYDFSTAFKAAQIDQVVFYGYNCDAAGLCGRASDKAQFALDNIDISVNAVPEPSQWLLVGVALVALGASTRRRNPA